MIMIMVQNSFTPCLHSKLVDSSKLNLLRKDLGTYIDSTSGLYSHFLADKR
jgi:hypothetical protein